MEQTKNDESIAADLNDLAINAGIEDHHAAGVSPVPRVRPMVEIEDHHGL
ncbi:hypothetical protein MtrunA17_Chr8g0377291 [Medicago truncatula]|uniref:Uncharacterized protein n=2 Tax=Medicago truncatula TaxID=3880 RepID=A0A396GSI8_MEDTR|nr:hypothetical protein MtrunA17_Chr8g0377291 [Medicago truncatula]